MKDILYPEEIKQEHNKRLLTLNRREKMYYLIEQIDDGQLDVRAYTKRELEREINNAVQVNARYEFVKCIKELNVVPTKNAALLINGDIVVPREKRVVVEYEVE